jgi:hypothetical protein
MEPASPVARCQSCGGHSADGDLCKSCRQAFAPVLSSATVAAASDDSATAAAQEAPAVDKTPEVALPSPPVVNVDAAKIEAAKAERAKAAADLTVKAHLARAANPAPVARRPIVPIVSAPPQRRSRTPMLITAAAVIVVAIGAAEGARRLGFLWPPQAAREGQPVQAPPAVESVTAGQRQATPPDTRPVVKVVAENRASAIAPAPATAPAPASPKPRTVAGRRAAVRQSNSSNQRVVPVVAPAPVPEAPAPVPTRSPALVAAESPRALAPPTGRFFERNDVDELPKIATRVEPQLPANLPRRPSNDIVVVRLLVSRTGHPFRVSLLRGSMLGRSSDEAVVAAVIQWTFSPAKKRGEPVNCWFNIGVPISQAN